MAELRRALASQQAEIAESRAVEQRDHSRALADAASKAEEAAATVSATHAREREASAHQLAELTARLERATAQYEVAEREVAEACGRLQAQSQNHEAVLAEERQLLVQAEDMHAAEKQQLEVKHATAIAQLRAEYEAALVEERTKSDAAHQEVLSKTVAERESAIRQQKVEQERAYEDQRASEQKRHQHLLDELHAEKEALSEECGLLEERLRVRDDTLAVSTTSRYDELSAAVEPSGSGEVDNRIAHGGGVDGLGASPGLLNATDVHRLQEQIANLQGLLEPRDEADDLITAPRSRGEGFIGVNSRRTPSVRPRASPRSSSPGRSLMSPRPLSSSGPSRPQPVIPPDLDGELNSSHSRASVAGARRNVALSRAATDTAVAADSPTASSNAAVYTLVVDVGGVVSCAGRDKDVRILDPTDGCCMSRMEGHTDRVWALAKVDEDTLASGSSDKTVRLWRPAESRSMHVFKGHKGAVQALQTHRGLLLSGSADQSVRLWDLAEGGCVGTLWQPAERSREKNSVHSLATTQSDVLASGTWGGQVRLWDLHRCRCTSSLDAHNGAVWALLHDQEGRRLFSAGSDGTVKIWDPRGAGKHVGTLGSTSTSGALYALAERDGLLLTGGYDQLVKVWDHRMMRCLNELPGHSGSVRCLAFQDSRLLSGSTDGTVRLWDFDTILQHGQPLGSAADESSVAVAL